MTAEFYILLVILLTVNTITAHGTRWAAITFAHKLQSVTAPRLAVDANLANLESPINYEPSEEEILEELLPKNINIQIYNQLLENSASEQGARMSAMESASNNAGKMIKNLTLVYNRTRQANITRELIDIVSGANAV